MAVTIYKANDKFNTVLSSGYTAGQNTLYVSAVPDNVPTIVVAGKGTDNETVFSVTGKTTNSLTGVARLRGANVDLDAQTPITCLNNEEFVNQYATQVGVTPWVTDQAGDAIEIDLDDGVKHQIILGADLNVLSLANVLPGHMVLIKLIQDGTGSRTVDWSGIGTIHWDSGDTEDPTLTTDASRADVIGLIQVGTDEYDGYLVGTNKEV
jgi:hypothetical protein